jgi:DNA-binding HxlR family transcriptional regulator
MELDGIVIRRDFHEILLHVEYSLTKFGIELVGVLRPLCGWGRRHMQRVGSLSAQIVAG